MSGMANPKPLASLSSTLLARPGHAKPAMRPQPFAQTNNDDLGWNDMGQAVAAPAQVLVPAVLAERAKLAEAVTPQPARTKAQSVAAGHKAAFTLRLDSDRHLRLRLASAVAGQSSQQLVVAALDAFLSAQPEVEALARQVPTKPASREKRS